MHPTNGRLSKLNPEGKPFSNMEDFLLNKAPLCLATQERFTIFQKELQSKLGEHSQFASVPCGLMGDLLQLNFSKAPGYHLVGLDLDQNSLDCVQEFAQKNNLQDKITTLQGDAGAVAS